MPPSSFSEMSLVRFRPVFDERGGCGWVSLQVSIHSGRWSELARQGAQGAGVRYAPAPFIAAAWRLSGMATGCRRWSTTRRVMGWSIRRRVEPVGFYPPVFFVPGHWSAPDNNTGPPRHKPWRDSREYQMVRGAPWCPADQLPAGPPRLRLGSRRPGSYEPWHRQRNPGSGDR